MIMSCRYLVLIAKLVRPAAIGEGFLHKIASSQGLIVSFAEHNSTYSAAYKTYLIGALASIKGLCG